MQHILNMYTIVHVVEVPKLAFFSVRSPTC